MPGFRQIVVGGVSIDKETGQKANIASFTDDFNENTFFSPTIELPVNVLIARS